MSIRKYKVIESVKRSLEFSSPVPGRPEVWWMLGIDRTLVREQWSTTQGELPYIESTLAVPSEVSSLLPGLPKRVKTYPFGLTKKEVVYDKEHPEIRLILVLGEPYEQDGVELQPILRSSVERDAGVDPKTTRKIEDKLWDEICRVERRGRPAGTGHPKRPPLDNLPIGAQHVEALRKAGLDDTDLKIFFAFLRGKKQKEIARELGMSPPAISWHWNKRIEPALKSVNPKFSRPSFKLSLLTSK